MNTENTRAELGSKDLLVAKSNADLTVGEKERLEMENDAKRAVPSKALLAQTIDVLQYFRESARHDGRRSDAQCYADAQWLLRRDSKANASLTLAGKEG